MACSIIRNNQTNEIEQVFAPNGNESKLFKDILESVSPDKEEALRLWAQVYTPSFKKWFGDWEKGEGSKIIDANGEPMMVYHGAGEKFDIFKPNEFGLSYFTADKEYATLFAQRRADNLKMLKDITNRNLKSLTAISDGLGDNQNYPWLYDVIQTMAKGNMSAPHIVSQILNNIDNPEILIPQHDYEKGYINDSGDEGAYDYEYERNNQPTKEEIENEKQRQKAIENEVIRLLAISDQTLQIIADLESGVKTDKTEIINNQQKFGKKEASEILMPVFLSIKDPQFLENISNENIDDGVIELAAGNDGIVGTDSPLYTKVNGQKVYKENITVYGIYSSNQVKSVNNQGNFSTQDNRIEFNREIPNEDTQKKAIGLDVITEIADRLSQNLGVKYEVISAEQAREITKDAKTPWNGEGAFFYNGKVYLTEEGFHMENVLHEFSHPLVDALYQQNKTLFDILKKDILATPEGQAIKADVIKLYPEYKENDPRFIKEIFVRALTKEAQNKVETIPTSKGFKGFIDKLVFAFKQLFRNIFGNTIKIEKLSTKTTLAELAKMLTSEKFDIDLSLVSHKDYVEFARNNDAEIESLNSVDDSLLSKTIKEFYDLLIQQISQISSKEQYSEAKLLLINDETGRGLLQEIKKSLESTANLDKTKANILSDVETRRRNATHFISAVQRMQKITMKVSDHIDKIVNKGDSQEIMQDIFYYDLLMRNWYKFINNTNKSLFKAGMTPSSALGKTLSVTKSEIDNIQEKIQKAYTPGVIDTLYESLTPLREGIDDFYKEQIKRIEDAKNTIGWGDKTKRIADLQEKWDSLKLTKERVANLVFGKEGDTNALSAYLEDFTNSPDPIVGGFAIFVKNAYNVVDAEFQRNNTEFMQTMGPLLKAAGYSMTNFVKFGKDVTFVDQVSSFDPEENKMVTKEYHTFLNEFKNVNTKRNEFSHDFEEAIKKGDTAEADRILKEQRQHLKDYFNQEYVDEYYKKEDIYDSLEKNKDLEDAVYEIMGVDKTTATADQKLEAAAMYDRAAKETYRKKYTILNAIGEQNSLNHEEEHYDEVAETKRLLWREYSQLASIKNLSDDRKEGEEYLSALIEKKYRKESNKFSEWVPIIGQFESSLEAYEQKLVDAKIAIGSPEFIEKRAKWIKDNTVVKYTQEYYDEKNKVMADIKEIFKRIALTNPDAISRIDSTKEMEEFLDIATGYRDQDKQIMGNDISDKAKARVKELQEMIIDKRDNFTGFSGLTKGEQLELNNFFDQLDRKEKFTNSQRLRFDDLLNKKSTLGVDKATQTELQALYNKLSDIDSKEATDYYVDVLNNWLTKMGEPTLVDNLTADSVLKPDVYVELLQKDPEFKKWFEKNHVKKEIFDYALGDTVVVYERLLVWNRKRPNNPDHYEHITLDSGERIDGVPTLSYFYRRVKDEYRTEKIVGKTVDNRGKFLPKTLAAGAKSDSPYINEEYYKLMKSNRAAFDALEKLKEFHLRWQEKLPRESKLYLQIPRYGNQSIEFVLKSDETVSEGKKWLQGIKRAVYNGKDDFDKDAGNFDTNNLVKAESLFNEDIRKTPVTGTYALKPEEVSMNIMDGMVKYMHSGLHQRSLIDLNPFAQALRKVLESPDNLPVETSKWGKFFATSLIGKVFPKLGEYGKKMAKRRGKQKTTSTRATAIKNFYEREFEGKKINDITRNLPWAHRIKSFFGKITSLSVFSNNINSAVKNRQAAMLEVYMQAGGGRFLDPVSLAKGKAVAWKWMVSENQLEIYKLGVRGLNSQIMQIFDAGQSFLEHSTHRQYGRSAVNDVLNLSFLMSQRAFLQFENTTEILCGMLYHAKVKQTINGATNEISYIDAWELRNGQVELKPGIDPEYAAGGKKFNAIKNQVHEVTNRLEGNYSRMGQPEINRYYIGQLSLFMKKFFTSMALNHFSAQRTSASLGTVSSGQYYAVLSLVGNFAKYGPQAFSWMSPDEASGVRKVMTQFLVTVGMNLILSSLLGYDDDDPDKFDKMRKRSGEMFSDSYNSWGWSLNTAIAITLATKVENETFVNPTVLIPQLDKMLSLGPLYERGIKLPWAILNHGYGAMTGGDATDYYKKDVGPYWYQKEGAAKVWADIGGGLFGFTGSGIDPVKAAQSQDKQLHGKGRQ